MENLEAVARSVGGLVAVLALVWLVARVMRGRTGVARGGAVRITQRVGLGRRSGVAVLEAGERRILVGVGDAQVTFLADLGPAEVPGTEESASSVVVREIPDVAIPIPAPRTAAPRGQAPRVAAARTPGLRELVVRAQERTVRR